MRDLIRKILILFGISKGHMRQAMSKMKLTFENTKFF